MSDDRIGDDDFDRLRKNVFEHPDRPDHPDFWVISEACIDTDHEIDHRLFRDCIERTVDFKSLEYTAIMRGQLLAQGDKNALARIAASFMDGFMVGAAYAQKKADAAETKNDLDAQLRDFLDHEGGGEQPE